MVTIIIRRTLPHRLAEILGKAIAAGEYTPGGALSPEALARTYGLSRTAVREALKILEAKGMINARPNLGTRVMPIANWNMLDTQVSSWISHTPVGEEMAKAAVELAGVVEGHALPGNPLYEQMMQLLNGYAR